MRSVPVIRAPGAGPQLALLSRTNGERSSMRITSGVMAVLFAAYGAVALCSGAYGAGYRPTFLSVTISAFLGLGAVYRAVQIVGTGAFLDATGTEMIGVTEHGRELLGLLLAGGWAGILGWWGRARRSDPSRHASDDG